jgi:hypothetical protein
VEAHRATVDDVVGVQRGRAMDLAAEAEFRVVLGPRDARFRLMKRSQDLLRGVADRRDDSHPGDDDASHDDS